MSQIGIDAVFKIIAKNPPSIAIAGGILMMILGNLLTNPELSSDGRLVFFVGVLLQIGWLAMQYYANQ